MASILLLIAALLFSPHCRPCQSSDDGVKFIQGHEGYMPFMYQDAVGFWTIGYGHLMNPEEIDFYKGVTLTFQQVDAMFRKDLQKFDDAVNQKIIVQLEQTQFDAVVSFTFNVGTSNFNRSTLLRKMNLELHEEVPSEFLRWNRARGRVLRGLTRRRFEESVMYALPITYHE